MCSVYSSVSMEVSTDFPYEHHTVQQNDKKQMFIINDSIDSLMQIYPEFVISETHYNKKTGDYETLYAFDFERSEEEIPFVFDHIITIDDYKYTKILEENGTLVVYAALPKHSNSSSWYILHTTDYFRRGTNSDEIIYETRLSGNNCHY